MSMKSINTPALVAAHKALAAEIKSRADLSPNTYSVDDTLTLDLKGTIVVNPEEKYTPTISIPLKVTLALFVRYSGITGAVALNALEKAMSEALDLGDKAEENVRELADIAQAEKKVKKMIGELPKATRSGKTLIKVECNGIVKDAT